MKKILCVIISLIMVLTSSISIAYAKPIKNSRDDDMKFWKEKLKQYYSEKNKTKGRNNNQKSSNQKTNYQKTNNQNIDNEKQEYIRQIVNIKREYNIRNNCIFLNGEEVESEVPPVLKDGRLLVPLRAIVQALGARVEWNESTKTATITKGDTVIKIKLGSNIVYVNGKEYRIDVPAHSENSRIVIPVRFIAEKFNQKVEWDEETGSVIIEDGDDEDDNNNDNDNNDDNNNDDNQNNDSSNLALNRSVEASSYYSSSYAPQKAVDGNTSTRWSSEYGDDTEWIYADLGSRKNINKVKLIWGTDYAIDYKLYKSNDANSWTEIYSTTSGDGGTDSIVFATINARYIKMYASERATDRGYSLYEFEVYGTTDTPSYTEGAYEAENASLSSGANIDSNHSGYSGSGFVSGYWNEGATTTFTVNTDSSGEYDVRLRYSNATGSSKTLSVYVNGNRIRQTTLSNLASWNNWSDATERLSLNYGSNTIAYRYDSNDSGNVNLDYIKLTKITTTNGSLSGSLSSPASSVNLSSEGTRDWAHWGYDSETRFNHKSGVTQQISNYTRIGSGEVNWFADNPVLFSWTGGTSNETVYNSGTGIYVAKEGNGFQITIPADTTRKTLKLYLGTWKSKGKVTASISDGSASAYSAEIDSSSGTLCKVVNINFNAASSGQTLTVKYVVDHAYDSDYGNVTLQAATLH